MQSNNPLQNQKLVAHKESSVIKWALEKPDDPVMKRLLQPLPFWLTQDQEQTVEMVKRIVGMTSKYKLTPVFVAYYIPNRDCGQHSAGGAADENEYRKWIRGLSEAIGSNPAIVILEPDALAHSSKCGGDTRPALVREALEILKASAPGAVVYTDIGHPMWLSVSAAAQLLVKSGIENARGFSLNVSNFQTLERNVSYGQEILKELGSVGGNRGFVIDTSRNGNGPWDGQDNWCNPPGRALGVPPSTNVMTKDGPIFGLDAVLWVKIPGESDGECRGGPPAGQFWAKYAEELARNAKW